MGSLGSVPGLRQAEHVLIAGYGYVGAALAHRLVARGHRVTGVRRSQKRLAGLEAPDGVECMAVDLTGPGATSLRPLGVDRVVYCVGADARTPEAYQAAYVRGLAKVIEALEGGPRSLKRLIFVSSTAVYHQDHGEWVDERSPTRPQTFGGRILLEAERMALSTSMEAVVARLAGIYGPGRTRFLRRLLEGESVVPRRFGNRIHRDDCAAMLEHLLFRSNPDPVYLGVDNEPADTSAVAAWVRRIAGDRPDCAPDAAGPVLGKRCSNARLRASGYVFQYPTFREGYAPLIEPWVAERR